VLSAGPRVSIASASQANSSLPGQWFLIQSVLCEVVTAVLKRWSIGLCCRHAGMQSQTGAAPGVVWIRGEWARLQTRETCGELFDRCHDTKQPMTSHRHRDRCSPSSRQSQDGTAAAAAAPAARSTWRRSTKSWTFSDSAHFPSLHVFMCRCHHAADHQEATPPRNHAARVVMEMLNL